MKSRAESRWNVKLPEEIEAIGSIEPSQGVVTEAGPIHLPWPPLSFDEIARTKETAQDWQLNRNYVPIMGDMHDLVCLDYSLSKEPEVVVVSDDRNELARFTSLRHFLDSLTDMADESHCMKIVADKSWLDF
ncbi:SMI1/KNR4 family protein [Roseovarius aestuarii]|uniref:Knr4/Smi1-like domain-containing protein n=1 Tax=Roseovarius aestuarii TaxID=475083 RepID=A0A1X7BTD7_9RHOB|nr:SMI1/KNR4 family protein [Roseovarius aestuarii]SMC12844.1 hypothetical protein ROA7745_02676 [Roseovarius aestuarii]